MLCLLTSICRIIIIANSIYFAINIIGFLLINGDELSIMICEWQNISLHGGNNIILETNQIAEIKSANRRQKV